MASLEKVAELQNLTSSLISSSAGIWTTFVTYSGTVVNFMMPSIRSFSAFLAISQTVFGISSPVWRLASNGSFAACPDPQLSCHNSTAVENLCCFNSPGGSLLQTQFWDANPATGPEDSWTIHGLWVWFSPVVRRRNVFVVLMNSVSYSPIDATEHTMPTATIREHTPTSRES